MWKLEIFYNIMFIKIFRHLYDVPYKNNSLVYFNKSTRTKQEK